MAPLTQLIQQPMDFMLSCSNNKHIQFRITQQLMDKLSLLGNWLAKAQYLCSMQVDTNWYYNQHPQQHVLKVPTRTILHTQLEVNAVTDFFQYPQVYVTGHKKKIHIKTAYMFD